MITKRQKKRIIIISIIVLLVMIVATFITLYIKTDMFKSDATLFAKYMGQNVENLDDFYKKIGTGSEYDELLQKSKYINETKIKVNHIKDIGTTLENAKSSINQLTLNFKGQTDNSRQYNYQDIVLNKEDKKVAEIEFLQNGNTYGIKFTDLFAQYILVDNENLKELFRKIGYTEEQVANIPDTIEFKNDIKGILEFSEEEKKSIQEKYIKIINNNVSKNNFSKQKNKTIQIGEKSINTNAYILTLTKEQMNNLFIKSLEEIKQDEIFLSKIDKIQDLLEKKGNMQGKSLRELFIEKIDNMISNITRNNIGQEETKITVYENLHTTRRTQIQTPDYQITVDILDIQEENYLQITFEDIKNKKSQTFTCKKTNVQSNINFKDTKDEKITQYDLLIKEKKNGENCIKDIVAKYEDDSNKVEATIIKETNIVDNFDEIEIKENNSIINLSKIQEQQVQFVLKQINDKLSERVQQIKEDDLKENDLLSLLKAIGLVKEGQSFEVNGITETEKKRFNSKFELLQGESLAKNDVLNLIEAIKNNLVAAEVFSNSQLKLSLDRVNSNENVYNALKSFVDDNDSIKFSAKVEYNDETGLVSAIIINMFEK